MGEAQMTQVDKIIQIRQRRKFLLEDWMFLLEFMHIARVEIRTVESHLIPDIPTKILYIEALDSSRWNALKLLLTHSEEKGALSDTIRLCIVENFTATMNSPQLQRVLNGLQWLEDLRNGKLDVIDSGSHVSARHLADLLRIKTWEQNRDTKSIGESLKVQSSIDILFHLDKSSWKKS